MKTHTYNKIIVRMPNWIGDLVMATPLLTDLRKKIPNAELTVMCKKELSDLLKKDQDIDEIFSFSSLPNRFLHRVQRRNIIHKIQEGQYDLGILTTNSFSSAWLFFKGNVQTRLGFSKNYRRCLLTNPLYPSCCYKHQVEVYKELLIPLGIQPSLTLPRIFLEEEEINQTQELLIQRKALPEHQIIGIAPGASYGPAKKWPEEKFFQLAQKLSKNPHVRLVFVGDASVTPFAKKMCLSLGDNIIDLTGTTSLRTLCSLIKLFTIFITNDSGPMHIAAALKVPLIALFGSTSPELTGPYKHGHVFYEKVPCSPCFKRVCPIDFPCMKKIDVEKVYQKVCDLIKK